MGLGTLSQEGWDDFLPHLAGQDEVGPPNAWLEGHTADLVASPTLEELLEMTDAGAAPSPVAELRARPELSDPMGLSGGAPDAKRRRCGAPRLVGSAAGGLAEGCCHRKCGGEVWACCLACAACLCGIHFGASRCHEHSPAMTAFCPCVERREARARPEVPPPEARPAGAPKAGPAAAPKAGLEAPLPEARPAAARKAGLESPPLDGGLFFWPRLANPWRPTCAPHSATQSHGGLPWMGCVQAAVGERVCGSVLETFPIKAHQRVLVESAPCLLSGAGAPCCTRRQQCSIAGYLCDISTVQRR